MIAYNIKWLENLFIREQTATVLDAGCINKVESEGIYERHPVGFYTPNLFIRIGLFLLTIVIALFSFGLITLILMAAVEKSFAGLIILYGLLLYAALEFMVQSKHHFRSGVDDALLWMSSGMLFGGVSYGLDASSLAMCYIAFFIGLFYTIRFADRLITLAVFLSLMGILFFTCSQIGGIVKAVVPFVVMIAAATIYFITKMVINKRSLRHYTGCFTMLEIAALMAFYIGGNYFVVRELSNIMFNLNLREGESIPYGKLFWAFTIVTPLLYIGAGIKRKDAILIRSGLLLVAATVFTIRYYYHVAGIEIVMTIGGIVLIIIAYALIRLLKEPKFGFTYAPAKNETGALQIESLVITETFSTPGTTESGTQFGGGSFGGGGAGSQF